MSEEAKVAPVSLVSLVKPCEEHLCVKDTFWMLTGKERAMPGDCYCVRCQQQVPYVLGTDGKAHPV